jgi:sugar O-acyltransferase (sialic acid O-acetyltransferase NeuD family)
MLIMIGAGGHARVLYDCIIGHNRMLYACVDPKQQEWLAEINIKQISEDDLLSILPGRPELFIGFVGLDCKSLEKRVKMMQDYEKHGAYFTPLIHPTAFVSKKAVLGKGVQALPNSVINSGAVIGDGAVINSGAVVEHDAHVGAGVHVAPKAVVLGGAKIGDCAYIASGAVIVQNSTVTPKTFIKALTVHK